MQRALFCLLCLCLSITSFLSVSALSGDLIPNVRDSNLVIKDQPIIVVPTPTPTTAIKIKLPLGRTLGTITVIPTVAPTNSPTQVPTITGSITNTPTASSIISPTVLPNDSGQTAGSNSVLLSPTPVQSDTADKDFDIKEIVGIGLVIFLILVIVFQSRRGNKKDPIVPQPPQVPQTPQTS